MTTTNTRPRFASEERDRLRRLPAVCPEAVRIAVAIAGALESRP